MGGSIVTDPVCGVSGKMGLPDDADAAAGQKLPRNAFFQLTHATDLQMTAPIVLREIRPGL